VSSAGAGRRSTSRPVPARALLLFLLLAAGNAVVVGLAPAGAAPPPTIPLPTPDQFPSGSINPTALLGPDRPGEILSHAPGPVADDEVVHVGLGLGGEVRTVIVDQRLTVSGVGDFELNVPGPAADVTGPVGQSPQPGLRRGAVVWQGFSPGTKVLRSTVTLDPGLERLKLPLRVSVRRDAGVVVLSVANATAAPVALAAGRAPIAGADGLPVAIPAMSAVRTLPRPVTVPFAVRGQLDDVAVDALLPSADHPDGSLVLRSRGPGRLRFTATASLPDPATVGPGAGLAAVEVALTQVLRRGQFTHYLGSPVAGPETTTYEYGPAPAAAPRAALAPPGRERLRPGAVVLAALAGVALVAAGAAVWARS